VASTILRASGTAPPPTVPRPPPPQATPWRQRRSAKPALRLLPEYGAVGSAGRCSLLVGGGRCSRAPPQPGPPKPFEQQEAIGENQIERPRRFSLVVPRRYPRDPSGRWAPGSEPGSRQAPITSTTSAKEIRRRRLRVFGCMGCVGGCIASASARSIDVASGSHVINNVLGIISVTSRGSFQKAPSVSFRPHKDNSRK
jgi:hypothetical protein